MAYISWEEYQNAFDAVMDETAFYRYEKQAEQKMKIVSHFRTDEFLVAYDEETATDFEKGVKDAIRMTCGELISQAYSFEANGQGLGVSSVSNDGYSESYAVTTKADSDKVLNDVILTGLRGTGLVGAIPC